MLTIQKTSELWTAHLLKRFGLEVAFLAAGYLAYLGLRLSLLNDVRVAAFDNAERVIRLERFFGVFWEPALQQWLLEHWYDGVVFLNWFYTFGFFPVLIPLAVYAFLFHHRTYIHYRYVFLISLGITWLIYYLFPLAPPRLVPLEGFVDSVADFGTAIYTSRESMALYNPYSAMPSMHFGWTLLVAIGFYRTGKLPLQIVAFCYPALVFLAVILTANHYFVDPVAGGLIVVASFRIHALLAVANPRLLRSRNPVETGGTAITNGAPSHRLDLIDSISSPHRPPAALGSQTARPGNRRATIPKAGRRPSRRHRSIVARDSSSSTRHEERAKPPPK